MKTNRWLNIIVGIVYTLISIAKIVGMFILITYLSFVISGIIIAPLLDASDVLAVVYPNVQQWQLGVYIELGNAIGVLGIALFMYPFLKKYNEGLALFYVGIRMVEAVFSAIASMRHDAKY